CHVPSQVARPRSLVPVFKASPSGRTHPDDARATAIAKRPNPTCRRIPSAICFPPFDSGRFDPPSRIWCPPVSTRPPSHFAWLFICNLSYYFFNFLNWIPHSNAYVAASCGFRVKKEVGWSLSRGETVAAIWGTAISRVDATSGVYVIP